MQDFQQPPNWQPITFLSSIAEMIDEMLEGAQDVHASLQQARTQPHVMDDYTIGRVHEVYGAQLEELWLYEEQLSRWRKASPTAIQRQEAVPPRRRSANPCSAVAGCSSSASVTSM